MDLCSDDHEEICYEGRSCPLCDVLYEKKKEIESLEREVENKDQEISDLSEELDEYKSVYDEMKSLYPECCL